METITLNGKTISRDIFVTVYIEYLRKRWGDDDPVCLKVDYAQNVFDSFKRFRDMTLTTEPIENFTEAKGYMLHGSYCGICRYLKRTSLFDKIVDENGNTSWKYNGKHMPYFSVISDEKLAKELLKET